MDPMSLAFLKAFSVVSPFHSKAIHEGLTPGMGRQAIVRLTNFFHNHSIELKSETVPCSTLWNFGNRVSQQRITCSSLSCECDTLNYSVSVL